MGESAKSRTALHLDGKPGGAAEDRASPRPVGLSFAHEWAGCLFRQWVAMSRRKAASSRRTPKRPRLKPPDAGDPGAGDARACHESLHPQEAFPAVRQPLGCGGLAPPAFRRVHDLPEVADEGAAPWLGAGSNSPSPPAGAAGGSPVGRRAAELKGNSR